MKMNDLLRMLLRSLPTPYQHRKLNRARLYMLQEYGVQPMPESLKPLVSLIDTLYRLKKYSERAA